MPRIAGLAAILMLFSLLGGAVAIAQPDGLTVDLADQRGTISPFVYGANYGPWGLVSSDMLDEAAQSGVTHLRFPAGNHGDQFDIQTYQIDLFMTQARTWNAVPSISVRLAGGTPERAAAMVRYVNIEKGYGVRYWSIGNEPDLYRDYSVERFNEEWREYALAMRAVDPDILLMGPEVSQFPATVAGTDYTNVRREWVRSFLQANGDLVDIVSIHRYPFPESMSAPPTSAEQLRADAPQWDTLVENLRTVIRETLGEDRPMALTEVNSHWNHVSGAEGSPDSFYHAIWWADVLGRLIRQQVEIVNYFALSTFGDTSTYGLLDRYAVRPTYYVYQLYRQFGTELLGSASTHPDVTVTAALREDGVLTLMIVNRAPDEMTLPLTIAGAEALGEAAIWRFDQQYAAAPVGTEVLTPDDEIALPGQSISLYLIPLVND
ncbi:hypothetical protein QPK87_12510 [Kamptonema cortianum]|nr:hypothetical protein [Kamptonema cortianum]